jgi:phenylalanyl-tRNA synthetase beta chain
MYISINWIKDFVDLDGIDIENLIYKFTMSTAEVEEIIKYGEDTKGVVVGKVVSVENVKNSDKLHKVIVDIGNKQIQSICGAQNVRDGIKIAFAPEGSIVNGVNVVKSKLAGLDSEGICLSEKELGFSDDHSGIMILEDNFEVGTDIKKIIPLDDIIYEIDNKSLTNRPDLWGHYGIAREIAAITKRDLKPLEVVNLDLYNDLQKLNIDVENKNECYRYSAITIENVNKKTSSYKMRTRLYYCGLRSKNLLADLTNYIMLELGQPMHAFDKRYIDKIKVGTLKEDISFKTLDGNERTLDKGTLMIWNNSNPVAIAGVMGGENTQIMDDTTALFLESANFDGTLVRKTANKLALRTDAATRYEKTLDPELTKLAIARFIKVLKEEDQNVNVTSAFTDVYLKKYPEIIIDIDKKYIDRLIGVNLTMEEISSILTRLKYDISIEGKNINIKVPSFRATKDVTQKADIIEEIARIHGYDNIEPKTNFSPIVPVEKDYIRSLEYNTKEMLATKFGMSEIHSYVWYDTDLNRELEIKVEDNLKIVNALNKQDSTLRSTMAPTIIYAINKNLRNFQKCNVFEIGRTFKYENPGQICEEMKVLGIGLADNKKTEEELVFELKSMIDSIFKINKNINVEYQKNNEMKYNWIHPVNSFVIKKDNLILGYMSVLNPKIKNNINSKFSIVVAELRIDILDKISNETVKYKETTKYQTVNFDLSIIVSKDTTYGEIEKVIKEANMEYLIDYSLVDVYINNEKLKDTKNITVKFNIGSYTSTLTKDEIDLQREKILSNLEKNNMHIAI